MSQLQTALPTERLRGLLPPSTVFEVFTGEEVIRGHEQEGTSAMYAAALNAWHQLVKAGIAPDPRAIAPFIDDNNPDSRLFEKIERILGRSVLIDCAWLRCEFDGREAASVILVQHFPSCLLLADVAFCNPTSTDRRGLAQLLPLIEDLRQYANGNDVKKLTAVASDLGISGLLSRYGIPVENSEFAQIALLSGHSIPHEEQFSALQ